MELVKVEKGQIEVIQETVDKIVEFKKQEARMKMLTQQLNEELLKAMEENGVVNLEFGELKVSYKKGHTRDTIDTKALKEYSPELAEKFTKTSEVKSSVTIKID